MANKGVKILIFILMILIIGAGAVLAYKIVQDKEKEEIVEEEKSQALEVILEQKEVQIFKGNNRPIAIMIDNHNKAWPQARTK